MNPQELKYHKEHTWARIDDGKATIGITHHAQEALGDIVYIELPEMDSQAEISTEVSEIESTKATSSVISPVTGTIIKINEELEDTPEIINEDPYGKGWIAVVDLSEDINEDVLIDASDYTKYIEEESK